MSAPATMPRETIPRERPILFSAPMVRAILDGSKTQTRRPIKPVQPRDDGRWPAGRDPVPDCPFGRPGDRLWVRETFATRGDVDPTINPEKARHYALYRASYNGALSDEWHFYERWRPSIHMPRWASRIDLEVTSVRVERVQDISRADAEAEGFSFDTMRGAPLDVQEPDGTVRRGEFAWAAPEYAFGCAWSATYPGSWERNEWVWVVGFKRVDRAAEAA